MRNGDRRHHTRRHRARRHHTWRHRARRHQDRRSKLTERHYLDHAATTPLREEASRAIASLLESGSFYDPGRPYAEARIARDTIERAREDVAALVGARGSEIVFTSSGTEAANLACRAVLGTASRTSVAAAVEHSSVRLAASRSAKLVELGVDGFGRVDLDHLDRLLTDAGDGRPPGVVHCQLANHEVGTLQPVSEVVARCRAAGVVTHVDACSGAGTVPIDFPTLGADLLSLSSHKLGGPAGIGALVVRRGLRVDPLLVGGDQERRRRAGMENFLGIVGFGAAARALAVPGVLDAEIATARARTERLLDSALLVPGVVAYGDTSERLAHLVCLGVVDLEAEGIVLGLDQAGVAVHSGSACSSEALEPSPVLAAMGIEADRSLRLSVGWSTTDEDIEAFTTHFPEVVTSLRALRR